MLTDQMFLSSVSAAQDESSYFTGLFIILAVGILMFFVAFLGFCGALRESPCMLMTFFCFVLIIVVAEIAAMAWAYNNSAQLEEYIRESVKTTVQEEYGVVPSRTKVFDDIQMGLRCCGANGPRDWAASKYNKGGRGLVDLAVSSTLQIYNVPESCCNPNYGDTCNSARAIAGIASKLSDVIYDEGCIDKLMNTLKKYSNILIGIGISIGVVECLGLIFSIILCCGIRNNDRYKA
ncbi:CD9 antigen [Blattella germanica]|nr:CD9 antigen [Blattella germanica]